MKNPDFVTFLVRNADYSIDHDATAEKFREYVYSYAAKEESQVGLFHDVVHAVFDDVIALDEKLKGKSIPSPTLLAMAMAKLSVPMNEYAETADSLATFIRAAATDGGAFKTSKGKNGGVARLADVPPPAPPAAAK